MNITKLVLAIAFTLFALSPALGDETRYVYREGEVPEVSDLVAIFGGQGKSALVSRLGKRKSFSDSALDEGEDLPARIANADPKVQGAAANPAVAPSPVATSAKPQTLALPIRFKRNSEVVAPSEAKILENIAHAMRQVGTDARFLIEGHTDATGSATFNMNLSTLRALSVKEQLVRYGVPAQILTVAGAGSTRLLDPANPNAGTNRRVEFKRISAE